MTLTLDQRAAELVEQAVVNLENGIGCSTREALRLLVIQASIRLPGDEALQILQQMHDVAGEQYE